MKIKVNNITLDSKSVFPKKGQRYYAIEVNFFGVKVESLDWSDADFDYEHFKSGNFFTKKSDAEELAKTIQKVFDENTISIK